MTPAEREEIDLIHVTIHNINQTLKHHQANLDAKEENLAAKERNLADKAIHLNKLTAFAAATRILLVAFQHAIASNPELRAALKSALADVAQGHEDNLLFSTALDEEILEIRSTLDRLLQPDLKP